MPSLRRSASPNVRVTAVRCSAALAACAAACGPLPADHEVGTATSALVQSSSASPAIGRNATDGRLLVAFTVEKNGQRDIWGRLMRADGSSIGNPFVISGTPFDEFSPSVAGGSGKFLVTFTTSFGAEDSDPHTVVVDSATGSIGADLGLDTSFSSLHTDGRCVLLSATSFRCVYRSNTELISLDLASNGVITNRQPVATRRIIRSPSLAFSAPTGRLLVAWNSGHEEDIELAVRSNGSNAWVRPSTTSFPRQVCATDNCINSGDNVSVTWNPASSKFGVAIANDLSDGSWVEGFILPDDCSATSCTPLGNRAFRLADKRSLGDVAIAPADRNFVIAYVYDDPQTFTDSSLATVGMSETGLRLQTSIIARQPSPIRNPLIMNGGLVGTGTGAALTYRATFDSSNATPVSIAVATNQGAVTGVFSVAQ